MSAQFHGETNMDSKKQKTSSYVKSQLKSAAVKIKTRIADPSNQKYPFRKCYDELNDHLKRYIHKKSSQRIVMLYGMRGVGKTTLISQLYDELKPSAKNNKNEPSLTEKRKLFISLDDAKILKLPLHDIIVAYEELLGEGFEYLTEPVFLFLDEVGADPEWAEVLKTLYDRTDKVFVIATGSSASKLQQTPDLARRSIRVNLNPMSFTEYLEVKWDKSKPDELSRQVKDIIFNSKNADEVFSSLKQLEKDIELYWDDVETEEINRYLKYGTLPFAVSLDKDTERHKQIEDIIERSISRDAVNTKGVLSSVSEILSILYIIASSDKLNVNELSKEMMRARPLIDSIIRFLEKTEMIWRVHPYGSHNKQVRKPSKYLFTSSAIRSFFFNFSQNIISYEYYKGKLLEDVAGLILRELSNSSMNFSVTYDSSKSGADFIIKQDEKIIVMEVGHGSKNIRQASNTMKRIKNTAYGIIISRQNLKVNSRENIATVPMKYFLLI